MERRKIISMILAFIVSCITINMDDPVQGIGFILSIIVIGFGFSSSKNTNSKANNKTEEKRLSKEKNKTCNVFKNKYLIIISTLVIIIVFAFIFKYFKQENQLNKIAGDVRNVVEIFYPNKVGRIDVVKEEYYVAKELKSKKSKAILPLPEVLKEEMIEWFKKNPYERVIVDKQGNYINPTCLSNEVKMIAKKLNIHFNFHMLRHTYATTLITNDVDIKTAQELMRHSNFNTTLSLYTHIGVERKKKVVNEIFKKKSGEIVADLD